MVALYWHLTRRRVRARNRLRIASIGLPFVYTRWIEANECSEKMTALLQAVTDKSKWQPRFSILLHSPGNYTTQQLARSKKSIESQIYPNWELIGDADDPIGNSIARSEGDFVVLLRVGNMLSKASLIRLAEAIQANRNAAILYGDEDQQDERGKRSQPWFKPAWNEEMFLSLDYLSSNFTVEAGLAREICTTSAEGLSAFLMASVAAAGGPVVHVPHILCHVDPGLDPLEARLDAVSRHVGRFGAICSQGAFGTVKVSWPLPNELPLVSIIIPTKDKIELLRPCVEGVLAHTDYDNFEILIVDNASVESRTADYLNTLAENPKIRILAYPEAYNYSAINNFAVRQARGSYVCLLNNDTEVVEHAWLTELMRFAVRPSIGAAGAMLLYKDRSIQHAGVVIGIGEAAGHAHRFLPVDQPGYFRLAHVSQFVSSVTGACLVVEKSKFLSVGGLDEERLAVAFNDVDLCLKLERAGWRNVYVPHAVLLHHESKSRGNDMDPEHFQRYLQELRTLQDRWDTKTYEDPLHNPNLDRYSESFVIGV
jgi:GT2 family glycosyltransferase